MTNGQVWPKPRLQHSYDQYLKLKPDNFHFQVTGYSCDILDIQLKRYKRMLFLKAINNNEYLNSLSMNFTNEPMKMLNVLLLNPCEDYPSLNMDEKYEISINDTNGILLANSIWGILRGLETFSQLVTLDKDGSTFVIRCTSITDYPKFSHRGFLLDTSRHFYPVKSILDTLDAMSYSKLNVFHWHIVDDHSFPFQSRAFPNLSKKGAYGHSAIYTINDVKLIIEHAKILGIRVIPEFDTPGHASSWRLGGIPSLLINCSNNIDPNNFGPIDPTVQENYDFIRTLFTEVGEVFKDQYLHLGGDEVVTACWSNDKRVQAFMQNNNISNITELESYYFKNIFNITRTLETVPIVWEEVFDENIRLDPNVVVQIWKNDFNETLQKVLESGHPVLLSSCWYLNYIQYGANWMNYYSCDPSNTTTNRSDLILGGEACMWSEFVDDTNVLPFSWPSGCAVAEVLWSHVLNKTEAAARLEEHVCRMKRRGIPARPANGPNYCSY
ncbi:Hypothetical protein CINCED_3A023777 [Cinara cedri]|nr:Hypothetical protein CINCED_3A023777 [Cinara cedri]